MSIKKEAFGTLACGAQVERYTMTNALGANVSILNYGGIIEAIRVELGEKKARFLEGNIKALKAGMEYVRNLG